jgi:hypothetical protein
MGAKYNIDYLRAIKRRLNDVRTDFLQDYSIEIDGELNEIPLLEQMRFIVDMDKPDSDLVDVKEHIAKMAVLGKQVTVFFKGNKIGPGFTINDLKHRFDDQEVLRKHPPAYSMLLEVCSRKIVEKYLPPRAESDPPVAAPPTQGSQRQSGGRPGGN